MDRVEAIEDTSKAKDFIESIMSVCYLANEVST